MPICPHCRRVVRSITEHERDHPIRCAAGSLKETGRERRARILREAKQAGISVAAAHLKHDARIARGSRPYRQLVELSNTLQDGANASEVVCTLQRIGDILIAEKCGSVKELGALQTAAGQLGCQLDLAVDNSKRRRRASRLFVNA